MRENGPISALVSRLTLFHHLITHHNIFCALPPPTDTSTYYADDVIHFSDNGLWGLPSNPPYLFNYTFGSFQASRKQANDKVERSVLID